MDLTVLEDKLILQIEREIDFPPIDPPDDGDDGDDDDNSEINYLFLDINREGKKRSDHYVLSMNFLDNEKWISLRDFLLMTIVKNPEFAKKAISTPIDSFTEWYHLPRDLRSIQRLLGSKRRNLSFHYTPIWYPSEIFQEETYMQPYIDYHTQKIERFLEFRVDVDEKLGNLWSEKRLSDEDDSLEEESDLGKGIYMAVWEFDGEFEFGQKLVHDE